METLFDYIVLSETHQKNNLGLYKLEGYSAICNNGSLNQNEWRRSISKRQHQL